MSNYCKYNLPEISRLLSHADLHTIELSRTFYQVTYLLCNTTKIALMLAFECSRTLCEYIIMYIKIRLCSSITLHHITSHLFHLGFTRVAV